MIAPILVALAIQSTPITLSRGADIGQSFRYWDVVDTFIDSAFPDSNFGRETILTCGAKRTVLIRFSDLRRALTARRNVADAQLILTPSFGTRAKFRSISRVLVPWGSGPGGRGISAKDAVASWCATWKQRRCGAGGIGWDKAGARGAEDVADIASAKAEYVDERLVISGLGPAVSEMLARPYQNYGFALQFEDDGDFASSDAERGKPELRITTTEAPMIDGADLAVEYISSSWKGPTLLPPKGTRITWTAKVTNIGKGDSGAFSLQWFLREQKRGGDDTGRSLATGESQTFSIDLTQPEDKGDHRINQVSARIVNPAGDKDHSNDSVAIDQLAIPMKPSSAVRSHTENQEAIKFTNETVLGQSLFSFSLDGCRERFRYEPVGEILTWKSSSESSFESEVTGIVVASGAPSLDLSRFPIGTETPEVFGKPFWRRCENLYAGFMGGDTRDDTQYPNLLYMEVDPWPDKLLGLLQMPTTELLGATKVYALHRAMGKTGTDLGGVLSAWPKTCIVRTLYSNGEPIGGLEVKFFRIRNQSTNPSGIQQSIDSTAEVTLTSTSQGMIVLPSAETSTLRNLKPDGSDALWLVTATRHGVTEFAWMRAYQWVDVLARSGKSAAILPLRFNLPVEPLEESINLAQGKTVVDNDNMLPELASKLVDGDSATSLELAGKEGQWIEVDIGRDRTIGQVQLELASDSAWNRFDIKLYGTGQRPSDVGVWAEEVNGPFAVLNRSDRTGGGQRLISYRGFPARARYIRIVNRGIGPMMRLSELRVTPLKG